jgi:hypothetical protein
VLKDECIFHCTKSVKIGNLGCLLCNKLFHKKYALHHTIHKPEEEGEITVSANCVSSMQTFPMT